MMHQIGKYLIIIGIVVVVIGVILFFLGNKLSWFGDLPGDIKIKRDNFVFYAPITSMILVSIVLSFLLWLFSKIRF
ncbi:MAG: DUF2905 domain-containing protein [Bacteroidales bacterium]|nr:DUF2905 domain-containing protein [Bacteroidales bacterium]MBS3774183.1 DUF2905 domain-containing protein [Bacteroidales bacterium]